MSPVPPRDPDNPIRDWVTEVSVTSDLNNKERMVSWLLLMYGILMPGTLLIIFLQGFRLRGFHLEGELLKWLGGATILQAGGLLTMTFGHFFKKKGRR